MRASYVKRKEVKLFLWKKRCGRCFYCKRKLAIEDTTIEHLKQRYRGGTDAISNLTIACRSCNSARGAMTPSQMIRYAQNKKLKMKKGEKEIKKVMSSIASLGGKKTFERYGSDHFSKLAKKSWKARRAKQKKG